MTKPRQCNVNVCLGAIIAKSQHSPSEQCPSDAQLCLISTVDKGDK